MREARSEGRFEILNVIMPTSCSRVYVIIQFYRIEGFESIYIRDYVNATYITILIPNRTFLAPFGSISDESGRGMVRILARRSRAKTPIARPNELDIPPKRTKIQPKI